MTSADHTAVLAAADACIDAFGRHDRDAYFAWFAPDASFVFHTSPEVLPSRQAWLDAYDALVATEGFRVLECRSSERGVQLLGDAAVFHHRVHTRARIGGEEATTDERETIVFARQPDGSWLAVHEHLSPTAAG